MGQVKGAAGKPTANVSHARTTGYNFISSFMLNVA
jgi:hypothetical protein